MLFQKKQNWFNLISLVIPTIGILVLSLIGPRPEQAGIVEQLREEIPYFESRHAIRPGLIGWAQLHVYAGNATESKRKLQYDLYYLKHRSFLFDVEILLKTIAHVFFLQGK